MPNDFLPFLLAFFGAGGAGTMLVKSFLDWRSGKVAAEKEENRAALRVARQAEYRAECEAHNRRTMVEYAAELRRIMREHGIEPPPHPAIQTCFEPPKPETP